MTVCAIVAGTRKRYTRWWWSYQLFYYFFICITHIWQYGSVRVFISYFFLFFWQITGCMSSWKVIDSDRAFAQHSLGWLTALVTSVFICVAFVLPQAALSVAFFLPKQKSKQVSWTFLTTKPLTSLPLAPLLVSKFLRSSLSVSFTSRSKVFQFLLSLG